MKIVGGTFGVSGGASLEDDGVLRLRGAKQGNYKSSDVRSVNTTSSKERKFSTISFLLGAIFFGLIGAFILGGLGVLIAVVISIAGSFRSSTTNLAEIGFADNETVTIECADYEVNRLVAFRG